MNLRSVLSTSLFYHGKGRTVLQSSTPMSWTPFADFRDREDDEIRHGGGLEVLGKSGWNILIATGVFRHVYHLSRSHAISSTSLALLLLFTLAPTGLTGTERYWIAHEAELIVVGKMSPGATLPWFDGWHLNGTIEVEEVLHGTRPPRRIEYRYLCAWGLNCQSWPPPKLSGKFTEKGLWFLRDAGNGTWNPSVGVGFDSIEERGRIEKYIRLYKR